VSYFGFQVKTAKCRDKCCRESAIRLIRYTGRAVAPARIIGRNRHVWRRLPVSSGQGLLDQIETPGIAVRLPVVSLDAGNDRKNQATQPYGHNQRYE
jgi:hypothetical protein